MSEATPPSVYAVKFGADVFQQAKNSGSVLLPHVYNKGMVTGKAFTQPRIGSWSMRDKGARGAKNEQNDPVLSNRYISLSTKEDSRVWTQDDEWKMIAAIGSPAMTAAASSVGQTIDRVIAAALGGVAKAGEGGGTDVALPSSQKILNGSSNLTVSKIINAAKILDTNRVAKSDRILAISPSGLHALLTDQKATSSDYMNVKALMAGDINTFYGFTVVMTQDLPIATNVRSCFAFHKNSLCIGFNKEPVFKFDELIDQSYDKQIYYTMGLGGGRLEEESVVQVDILETA